MTFPPASDARQLRPSLPVTQQSPLPQSQELGGALAEKRKDGAPVTKQPSPFAQSWAHFIAGGAGGMVSATLTAPLEVLKTRLQSDFYQSHLAASRAARGVPSLSSMSFSRNALLHVRETFQILFAIPRVEGYRALFRGLGPNLVGVVPARAINFYTYGNGKKLISSYFNNGQEATWVHLCAAACAGIVTGTATNPIWVVKTRLQLDKSHAESGSSRRYRNALDCTLQTVRQEGIRGLYRGLSASYLGVAESTLQWILYEKGKAYLARREARLAASGKTASAWDQTISWSGKPVVAGGAKTLAALITYPHEVVRTRLRQAPMQNGQLKYTGLVQCFKLIWLQEGIQGLYGGLVPHMLRVVPSAAIMFGTYESVLHLLGQTSGV